MKEKEREIHSLIKALTNLPNKLVMRSLYHVLDIQRDGAKMAKMRTRKHTDEKKRKELSMKRWYIITIAGEHRVADGILNFPAA